MKTSTKVTTGSGAVILAVASIVLLSLNSAVGGTVINAYIPPGEYHKGDIFDVEILCNTSDFVKAWECMINYDKDVLNAIQVTEGDIFSGYETFFNSGIIDNSYGSIINLYDLILGPGNVSEPGSLITIRFEAVGIGLSNISLYNVGVTNETAYIPIIFINSSIFIFSQYDINTDRVIDLEDIISVALHYGQTGAPGWIPEDVNNDGQIRLLDLVLVAVNWGEY